MTLERKDFAAFFAALHDGASPFRWQERLLDDLLERGSWPDRIVAPTGAGKTAAIDVHLFAVALTAGEADALSRLPRRLAMVVARRVLVDGQYEHARRVRAALADPRTEELAMVADRLWRLRRPDGPRQSDTDDEGPLVVTRLRGGSPPMRDWRDHPAACAVICATPDMWGSRLLFRGYGTARLARPREAGLLALDAAVVVDEAHLSGQLLATARQVSQLVRAVPEPVPVPALQVVETTATPAGAAPPADPEGAGDPADGREVAVTGDDLAADPVLRDRLRRPKPVTEVPVADWPAATAPQRRRVATRLADEVVAQLASPPGGDATHTVGCYVNTVAMAVDVADILRDRHRSDGDPLRVVTVCGQTRPADLERLRHEHPGVLSMAGDPAVDVLVTTQSLEVGVDLDLAAVVTELAPASALAQRAGRVNRRGRRPAGAVRVILPDAPLGTKARSGPYGREELVEAHQWVAGRAGDPAGLAPWAVRSDPPPAAAARRMLFQRPELADGWHWARTTDELAAEPELDLWLTEDFEADRTAGLVVRDAMPPDSDGAVGLIRRLRPREREVFTVPVATLRAVVAQAADGAEPDPPAMVRVRGDDVVVLDPSSPDIRPGDVVVADSRVEAFTASTSVGNGFSPQVPVRRDVDAVEAVRQRTRARDVLHTGAPRAGTVALRLEPAAWSGAAWVGTLLAEYAETVEETTESRSRRRTLRRLLRERIAAQDLGAGADTVRAAVALLGGPVRNSDLLLDRDHAGAPVRLLVLDRRRAWADERLRQVWIPQRMVRLDEHQEAVAARAAWVATAAGLPSPMVDALRYAGLYHDEGKADDRFQKGLRATGEDGPLAKSGGVPLAEFLELTKRAGLPVRWRHEQRSVVACWERIHAALPREYAQLAVRLVGTSHGHGRGTFPHAAGELLAPSDPDAERQRAEELFDLGAWDDLIETTHDRWGVWGCAYLEALLRAADGQASAEGT